MQCVFLEVLQKTKAPPPAAASKGNSNWRDSISNFVVSDDEESDDTESDSDDRSDDKLLTDDDDDLLLSTNDKENQPLGPSHSTTALDSARKPRLAVNAVDSGATSLSHKPFLQPGAC